MISPSLVMKIAWALLRLSEGDASIIKAEDHAGRAQGICLKSVIVTLEESVNIVISPFT